MTEVMWTIYSYSTVDTPRLIESLRGKKVVDAACGSSHSACILDNGSLYTWGKGRYGRLGHNDFESQMKPKQVCTFSKNYLSSYTDILCWCYRLWL